MKEEMRKYKSQIILFVVVLLFFYFSPFIKRPFKDLRLSEVESILVYAIPPGESVLVQDEERLEAIINALKETKTFIRAFLIIPRAGQGVEYSINFKDGRTINIHLYSPMIGINHSRFYATIEPLGKLGKLANTILGTRLGD